MDTRVLLATLVGGMVAFFGGWLIYGMLLDPYFQGQTTEVGLAVMKDPPEMWAIAVGNLIYSFLLSLIFSRWGSISTLKTGAIAGAIISGLINLSNGFMWHAFANMSKSMATIAVDALGAVVWGALVGGVIGWTLGYKR